MTGTFFQDAKNILIFLEMSLMYHLQLHRVLVCLDVVIGSLECPETGRIFPIRDGIPNLLVNEDEVS